MQPDRFTIKSQEAIAAAARLAEQRRNPQATPEHLLAVLLEQDGGIVPAVMRKLGVGLDAMRGAGATKDELLKAIGDVRGSSRVTDPSPEDKIRALEKFGVDLTERAA